VPCGCSSTFLPCCTSFFLVAHSITPPTIGNRCS
jgi:hypothetical protein